MLMVRSHRLTFDRFGRSYHLRLDTAEDLAGVLALDEAHWVATSMPTSAVQHGNSEFMGLVDTNHDGRIHTLEVKNAVDWLLTHLEQTTGVDQASETLELSAINTDLDQGRAILHACQKMLANFGLSDSDRITLDQIRQIRVAAEAEKVSEAGVVLPEAAQDENIRQFLSDIVTTLGGISHPGGRLGVDQSSLDRFLEQTRGYLDWMKTGDRAVDGSEGTRQQDDDALRGALLPLGGDTERAYSVLSGLRQKLDHYFDQCQLLAIDQRLAGQLPLAHREVEAADIADPSAVKELLVRAAIAPPVPDVVLDFTGRINPWYADAVTKLQRQVLEPIFGHSIERLTAAQWESTKQRFSAFTQWLEAKPADAVAQLGRVKLQSYLDPVYEQEVRMLIQTSHDTAFKLEHIRLAEKLVLYQINLLKFVNNFVSFPYLYDPTNRAAFEMGTLIMDGRRFGLAVRVDDVAQHAGVAKSSNMFVLYAQIQDLSQSTPYVVAVPVTSGGKGNLCVGKRGVFHDTQGHCWDAQIVKAIENPVSIAEAVAAPFKRLGGLISQKVDQMTGSAEAALDSTAQQAVTRIGAPSPVTTPLSVKPSQNQVGGGLQAGSLVAGGGIALAAIGSSLAYVSKIVVEFPAAVGVGLGGAILAVMVPNALLAFIRIRGHDLSAILEGSGWAINARMRLTRTQRRNFTQSPDCPGLWIRRWGWALTAVCIMTAIAVVYGVRLAPVAWLD